MRGDVLVEQLTGLEEALVQPDQKTFQDVINFPNRLNANLIYLAGAVSGPDPRISTGARERLDDLSAEWARYQETFNDALLRLTEWNGLVRDAQIPAVSVSPAK